MDTFSFIAHVKTGHICNDTVENLGTRFHTSNFDLSKHYLKEKVKSSWINER